MTTYQPGFTKQAEETAEEMRRELSLRNIDPLTPAQLAHHLDVPIIALVDLPALAADAVPAIADAVDLLQAEPASALSALTVFAGHRRLIVYNDRHNPARQASDLMHELSHGLLLHPAAPAFDGSGCRAWNTAVEDEASYLAGVLLIPGKAARYSAKAGLDDARVAARYGCSVEMATWRLNRSGARRFMTQR